MIGEREKLELVLPTRAELDPPPELEASHLGRAELGPLPFAVL